MSALLAHGKRPATQNPNIYCKAVFTVLQGYSGSSWYNLIYCLAAHLKYVQDIFPVSGFFILLVSWSPFASRLTADDGHGINPQSRRLRLSDSLPQMDPIRRNPEEIPAFCGIAISSRQRFTLHGQRIVVKCGNAIDSSRGSSLLEERIRCKICGRSSRLFQEH